jgi:hypothetical protein
LAGNADFPTREARSKNCSNFCPIVKYRTDENRPAGDTGIVIGSDSTTLINFQESPSFGSAAGFTPYPPLSHRTIMCGLL